MASARVLPSGGTTSLLLEREAQCAALQALAEAVRSGGGRLAVIEGSAGIGKTRLLTEARAIAGSAGVRVLAARGGEFEGGFAYGIVRQLFEPLLASASPELRAELLSGPAKLIAPLFGTSQSSAPQDAPAERHPRRDGTHCRHHWRSCRALGSGRRRRSPASLSARRADRGRPDRCVAAAGLDGDGHVTTARSAAARSAAARTRTDA